ncbi:hypothetical protein KS461_14960 [Pseudomonas chlororaphis]|uniref:hypothetical protein n=1 Tax=Pseudomonas chlororaphis TaxID=587753 RepID=UPI00215A8CDA|nr:hypothetical protein [Pseudomonas chlororaphis]UVE48527.1 hypothetical protein KS461_14960 [Pseudomonas chlororaphis]
MHRFLQRAANRQRKRACSIQIQGYFSNSSSKSLRAGWRLRIAQAWLDGDTESAHAKHEALHYSESEVESFVNKRKKSLTKNMAHQSKSKTLHGDADIKYRFLEKQNMRRLYYLIIITFLVGCNKSENTYAKSQLIHIDLNGSAQSLLQKSPVEFSKDCMNAVDMCWYKIQNPSSSSNLPSVDISLDNKTLNINQVSGITTAVSKEFGENLSNLKLTLRGLPDNTPHEDQRDFIYTLINSIKAVGWQHYFFPSDPRVSGSQAKKINSPDDVLGFYVSSHPWLDPDYEMDMDSWLKVGSFYNWYFFKDGVHLNLRAWRKNSKDTPDERGTYLITLNFKTEELYWLSGFEEKNERRNWRELLPARLKKYAEMRQEREEKVRTVGIEVDESYQDPQIKALEK